ncbi:MAG TPA: transposase [Pyrinomonadaceae bacterium]|nr:transposase [Pyrinomonadaceae bacterium]
MNDREREYARKIRFSRRFPKHSPPHFDFGGERQYLITAACYEHLHIVGSSLDRMTDCEEEIPSACEKFSSAIYTWCILPNHYHVLLKTSNIKDLRKELGLFHGRSSFKWNGEDGQRGRQVWHNCFERVMKSERHFYASFNYVINNAVHHGYVKLWQDWQWSNANEYLEKVGKEKAAEIWKKYPILNYGAKWDKFYV